MPNTRLTAFAVLLARRNAIIRDCQNIIADIGKHTTNSTAYAGRSCCRDKRQLHHVFWNTWATHTFISASTLP